MYENLLSTGEKWIDVSLDDFADCDSNLASNRQTRMLADLALVNCYNKTSMPPLERERLLLASAKRNLAGECPALRGVVASPPWQSPHLTLIFFSLAAMSFFGLTEYQKISQYIFEETFNLRFAIPFEQHNSTLSMQAFESLSPFQKKKIKDKNSLDMELYDFAKKLMFQR